MDPKDSFPRQAVYFIFFFCIAAYGFVYFEIFHQTEFKPEKPVVKMQPVK